MGMKTTMQGAIKTWVASGHLFVGEAFAIEMSGTFAWVVCRETRTPIKLWATRALAEHAIRKAITAYERKEGMS